MNGNRYLLDTNAIIYLLKGNVRILKKLKYAEWVGVSIISYIEFMAFPELSKHDQELFNAFIDRVKICDLTYHGKSLINWIFELRKKYRLPLPDIIIMATALNNDATFITADKELFKVKEVNFFNVGIDK